MHHVIKGKNTAPVLKLSLQHNEYVIARVAQMIAAQGDIRITPFQKTGLLRNLADKFKGHTLDFDTIHATQDNVWLMLSAPARQTLAVIDLYAGQTRNTEILVRQEHVIAAHQNIIPDVSLPRALRQIVDILATDIISLHVSPQGDGAAFISGYGSIEHVLLQPQHDLCIDAAHLVAWDSTVTLHPVKTGSLLPFGQTQDWGENRKLLQVHGSGSIWLQTRAS